MKKILSFICACSMVFAVTACGSQDSVPAPGTTAPTTAPTSSQETGKEAGSDILVAYFSATGTTKTVAGYISEVTGGDLYEIVPEIPYSSEDLNYNDNNSRSTREQNDEGARPVISGSVEDMDQYETIFLGYPIWHGDAPMVIDTFLESYDFTGKTIVPFCTSGGSGIGTSMQTIRGLCPDSTVLQGSRIGNTSEIQTWLNQLGFK